MINIWKNFTKTFKISQEIFFKFSSPVKNCSFIPHHYVTFMSYYPRNFRFGHSRKKKTEKENTKCFIYGTAGVDIVCRKSLKNTKATKLKENATNSFEKLKNGKRLGWTGRKPSSAKNMHVDSHSKQPQQLRENQ